MPGDEPVNGAPGAESRAELRTEEEPVTTGTLFLMIVFLMMIFGFWILMYKMLIGR